MSLLRSPDLRRKIAAGVAWNLIAEIFHVTLALGAMMILARLISPADYGRVGTTVAVLVMLDALSCSAFIAHALQQPDDVKPAWSTYLALALRFQGLLFIVAQVVASAMWFLPSYRSIAGLLHIGSIGLLFDATNRVSAAMLRRDLRFARVRIVYGLGTLIATLLTIVLAWRGFGAVSIVVGNNVALGIPFTIDLLLLRGWRPEPGWWRTPKAPAGMWTFAMQQVASNLLRSARSALAVLPLPGTLGYVAIGLLNRAQGLLGSTVGRGVSIVVESVYPVLPRLAAESAGYARGATFFLQAVIWIGVGLSIFVGFEGSLLSRVLYGERWVAMDPLLWPAAVVMIATTLLGAVGAILLAANRLKACLVLDMAAIVMVLPGLVAVLVDPNLLRYAWIGAGAQLVLGLLALLMVSPLLAPGWLRVVLPPVVTAAMIGGLLAHGAKHLLAGWPPSVRLAAATVTFGTSALVFLRLAFPRTLEKILARLPAARFTRRLLIYPATPSEGAP